MTDLTGVLTSTGDQLRPGLQHNAVATDALNQLRAEETQLASDAMHAADALSLAEHDVDSFQIRLRVAEQRAQQWQHAAAGLPEIVRSERPDPLDVDATRQGLADAEARLDAARREHTRACGVLQDKHNAAEALKRRIYAPSPDPVEVG